jgi:glycosyltransferase involved in cell wall biosynthesis/SAM-dependent methyltransferase
MDEALNEGRVPAPNRSVADAGPHRISVVVNVYNQAQFLGEALDSVVAQSHKADEIIVVDDGSSDMPQIVTDRYPGIRVIRQSNQGLAAARNAGLNAATAELIVFLDADDRLLPNALEAGIAALANKPECAFAFGGHRRIDVEGNPLGKDVKPPTATGYYDLLWGNQIGMHATVIYFRRTLLEAGGFDVSLAYGEDYDVYLRLAQRYPIAVYRDIVAEYRRHGENMSNNAHKMLLWVLKIHDRQWPAASKDPRLAEAWRQGQMDWRNYYRREIRAGGSAATAVPTPALASANIADLARTRPISDEFGYDRGTPIDRIYIEDFLQRNNSSISGRVLEVGDDTYSRRFGADRITKQDVLHITTGNPAATIVGDLSTKGLLPSGAFDCLVLTQTLHLVYDMRAAVQEMHRALRPGGVVLLTVPGITRIDRGQWGKDWFWSLTEVSARRLFAEVFGAENVTVESDGNVYAATLFLQGLAAEEADEAMLAAYDPCFPVLISVRAQKSLEWREAPRRIWKRLRRHG